MIGEALLTVFDPYSLLAILGGTIIGVVVGVVPGIAAGVGMTLLLPLLFYLPAHIGLLVLLSLWQADGYGGSISSILINVPGGVGAVFTALDGYPLAKKGKAGLAMGLAMGASIIGGYMGIAALMIFSPLIVKIAVIFGPQDYFILAMLGLVLVATTSRQAMAKGFIMAGVGLMVCFIGTDLLTGYARNSFGLMDLQDGIEFRTFVIGMYAIGRLVSELPNKSGKIAETSKLMGGMMEGVRISFVRWWVSVRAGLIGLAIGALPGTGVSVAGGLSYMDAKEHTKDPTPFGEGNYDGVLAPESANNSVQGGGLIPTLTLGVPGTSACAIFLGGLIMYGTRPGPELFQVKGVLVWTMYLGMIISILAFFALGLFLVKPFAQITLIPTNLLIPVTVVIALAGTYSLSNSMFDVFAALAFGVMGYVTGELKYPVVPAILGMIMGPIAEQNFCRAMLISDNSLDIFWKNPVTIILILLVLYVLIGPFIKDFRKKRKNKAVPLS